MGKKKKSPSTTSTGLGILGLVGALPAQGSNFGGIWRRLEPTSTHLVANYDWLHRGVWEQPSGCVCPPCVQLAPTLELVANPPCEKKKLLYRLQVAAPQFNFFLPLPSSPSKGKHHHRIDQRFT